MTSAPVALVTGAAVRLGAAIAAALCSAGYRVWAHHHASPAIDQDGDLIGWLQADLRDQDSRERMMRAVLDPEGPAHGRLDLLVNSAASFEVGAFAERTDAQLREVLELNLIAPLSLIRLAAPRLVVHGGSVINLLDLGALHPWRERLDHCVAKAGLGHATRALAAELAPVRVNAIAPGTILPPLDGPAQPTANIPRGRIGHPRAVQEAVLYLAGAEHVSGHILVLDGGQTAGVGGRFGS